MCSQSFYVILESLDLPFQQRWVDNVEAFCPINKHSKDLALLCRH